MQTQLSMQLSVRIITPGQIPTLFAAPTAPKDNTTVYKGYRVKVQYGQSQGRHCTRHHYDTGTTHYPGCDLLGGTPYLLLRSKTITHLEERQIHGN